MNNSLLYQQLFPELGGQQFTEALEMFLTTYAEVVLAFLGIVLICAIWLTLIEARQHRLGNRPFSTRQQKAGQPNRQHRRVTGYDMLRMEHDSLF